MLNRGDCREAIFQEDPDRKRFLETWGETCLKTGWLVLAYGPTKLRLKPASRTGGLD